MSLALAPFKAQLSLCSCQRAWISLGLHALAQSTDWSMLSAAAHALGLRPRAYRPTVCPKCTAAPARVLQRFRLTTSNSQGAAAYCCCGCLLPCISSLIRRTWSSSRWARSCRGNRTTNHSSTHGLAIQVLHRGVRQGKGHMGGGEHDRWAAVRPHATLHAAGEVGLCKAQTPDLPCTAVDAPQSQGAPQDMSCDTPAAAAEGHCTAARPTGVGRQHCR